VTNHLETEPQRVFLPDRRVSTAPTRIQAKLFVSYGKLPPSFEPTEGQTAVSRTTDSSEMEACGAKQSPKPGRLSATY
jgi:hypothetical protein